jgi:hypothetical protein
LVAYWVAKMPWVPGATALDAAGDTHSSFDWVQIVADAAACCLDESFAYAVDID